jgi:hypothetical protein
MDARDGCYLVLGVEDDRLIEGLANQSAIRIIVIDTL